MVSKRNLTSVFFFFSPRVRWTTSQAESNESSNEAAPENLSLPKRRDSSSPTEPDRDRSRLPSNYPNFSSFLETSAAAAAAAAATAVGVNSAGRSAVDVLRRVFPYKRRVDIENVLQRCNGDVLHAIELMVSARFNTIYYIYSLYVYILVVVVGRLFLFAY